MADKTSRVRTSERALRIALKAVIESGLTVQKVSLSGGKIEIHCVEVDHDKLDDKDNSGLKDW